ncbi:hypothetical protein TRVL_05028 [Trypanosoma vivax]|nr:hypothetical protein TRVL_05028 [Trypanosoma vivax]
MATATTATTPFPQLHLLIRCRSFLPASWFFDWYFSPPALGTPVDRRWRASVSNEAGARAIRELVRSGESRNANSKEFVVLFGCVHCGKMFTSSLIERCRGRQQRK